MGPRASPDGLVRGKPYAYAENRIIILDFTVRRLVTASTELQRLHGRGEGFEIFCRCGDYKNVDS